MSITREYAVMLTTIPKKELIAKWREEGKCLRNAPKIALEQRIWRALRTFE